MNPLATHKQYWLDLLQRESKYFFEYETIFPIYENWEQMSTAETVAKDLLTTALDTCYCSAPHEVTDKFLNWVIEVVGRALKDGKVHKTTAHSSFPKNRGQALRSRAYAKALLLGEFALADAKQALDDLLTDARQIEVEIADEQTVWYDYHEERLLESARLALILHDLDRFDELLPYVRKFKRHKIEHDLLIDLANATRQLEPLPEKLITRFTAHFEVVRAPTQVQEKQRKQSGDIDVPPERDLRRFEVGVIYAMYIDTTEPFTWQRAIQFISQ